MNCTSTSTLVGNPVPLTQTLIPICTLESFYSINRIYNKILDRDWFSARLFVT